MTFWGAAVFLVITLTWVRTSIAPHRKASCALGGRFREPPKWCSTVERVSARSGVARFGCAAPSYLLEHPEFADVERAGLPGVQVLRRRDSRGGPNVSTAVRQPGRPTLGAAHAHLAAVAGLYRHRCGPRRA